jgi:hypothetical protein
MTVLTKLTAKFSEAQIDDEIVVMLLDTGEFLSLSGTASAIWLLIDGSRDRDALVARLASEYDVPEGEIGADVDEFLGSLREAGLLAEG